MVSVELDQEAQMVVLEVLVVEVNMVVLPVVQVVVVLQLLHKEMLEDQVHQVYQVLPELMLVEVEVALVLLVQQELHHLVVMVEMV